jgi:POT family proton-dependent oligopeptide transporter
MFGYHVPTIMYLSLNPIFVVIFAPILAYFYNKLEAKKKDLTVVAKISLGLLTGSLCFFFLVIGGYYFYDSFYKISQIWIVLFFFLYTISDLLIGALGVAMVTRLAPKRLYGVMMGAWFLIGNALAAYVSGIFAGLSEVPASVTDPKAILDIYNLAFTKIGLAGVVLSVIIFAVNPHIKRIANIR